MSISQNFPEEGPTLNLNFAGSKILDPRITFARPSTFGDATYMDANGLIVTAAADEPRFDHRYVNGEIESLGLLIEEQRKNLISNSENFDTWTKPGTPAGASISQNVTSSPDGNNTADKIVETNTDGGHGIWIGFTLPSTTTYTFSVFLKAAERTWVDVRGYNPTNGNQFIAKIDLINGVFLSNTTGIDTNTVRLDEYLNGWWRFSGIGSFNNIYTQFFIAPIISNASASDNNYTGDGTSGVFVWGAQVEAGSFPTSYIPTSGIQATRSPDNVSMTGTNFSDWYNPSEGTFVTLHRQDDTKDLTVNYGIYSLSNSPTNTDRLRFHAGTGRTPVFSITNSAYVNVGSLLGINLLGREGELIKSSTRYSDIECSVVIEGSDLATDDTDIVIPSTLNNMIIGAGGAGLKQLCGHISQLTYYPTSLTDSQLQNLTK